MNRAGVALGSNLGERLANLRNARKDIASLKNVLPPIYSSAIYETEPVGCEPSAGKFLNAALEFGYVGEPEDLLRELAAIEKLLGRPGNHLRNTSRLIDLDLLYFGGLEIKTRELQLPHPRMIERAFVLKPVADIRPDLVLPNLILSVSQLLQEMQDTGGVVRIALEW